MEKNVNLSSSSSSSLLSFSHQGLGHCSTKVCQIHTHTPLVFSHGLSLFISMPLTHTYTHTHIRSHTQTLSHSFFLSHTLIQSHTLSLFLSLSHALSFPYYLSLSNAHTHTYTHTHTHSLITQVEIYGRQRKWESCRTWHESVKRGERERNKMGEEIDLFQSCLTTKTDEQNT